MEYWLHEDHTPNVGLRIKIREKIFEGRSPYQKFEILDSYEYGRMMLLDGTIMFTEQDEFFYHEMMTHIPLFTHDNPKRVLVIGGGDGGIVRQVLLHPKIERIDLVEIDRMVIAISRRFFPFMSKGLDDTKVHLFIQDGALFLREQKDQYDVIIIDSTDPKEGKPSEILYEHPFFATCFEALNDKGIMVSQVGSPLYSADLIGKTFQKLKKIFPITKPFLGYVPTYTNGNYLFAFCSKKNDPVDSSVLERIEQSSIEGRYYNKDIHESAFCLPNFVRKMVTSKE